MCGKIIVVDNCNATKKVLNACLKKEYKLVFAQKKDLFEILQNNKDVKAVLFALNPKNTAELQIISFLKSNFITFGIPIIFFLRSFDIKNFLSVTNKKKIEFDNFLKKPIDPLELKAKLRLTIQNNSKYALNPLTQLPGNNFVYTIIKERQFRRSYFISKT